MEEDNSSPTKYDTCISLLTVIFLMVLSLIISIIGLVVTIQNINDTCINKSVIYLPTWIYVSSAIGLTSSFASIPISLGLADSQFNMRIPIYINCILYALMFIWNIIGTIAFFTQLKTCSDMQDLLRLVMMSTLVCQWIIIPVFSLVAVYLLLKKKKSIDNMKELVETSQFNENDSLFE